MTVYTCDIAVIGGSFGGTAAALAAADAGLRVVLTESSRWIGGQVTSQGVSALDEHSYIEYFGGTRSYNAFRERVREQYRARFGATDALLNPGDGWVSRLCFEPRVGLDALKAMLSPYIEAGNLTVLLEHSPVSAQVSANTIHRVTLRSGGAQVDLQAAFFLDATDLGDLLPLVGAPYVTGAEARADTGEPGAPAVAQPDAVQAFTFTLAVEYDPTPGADHTIAQPDDYEALRNTQPFTLTLRGHDDAPPQRYPMFAGAHSFWAYRRIVAAGFAPDGHEVALINWAGNDYYRASIIDQPADARHRILEEARTLSLSFLYWLQTEAPHDEDGGTGFPGLRPRPDVMGTPDALAMAPYIRESRRLRAAKRIRQQDIAAGEGQGARAAPHLDSVGVGWYAIDVHACVGNPHVSHYSPTLPFQIPLGALFSPQINNLIAACKNIGTTHLSNGAYRVHPVEWNIGESAGVLAAYCVAHGVVPDDVWRSLLHLRRVQYRLLQRGVPLCWAVDVPVDDPLFIPTQMLLLDNVVGVNSERYTTLDVLPDTPLNAYDAAQFRDALAMLFYRPLAPLSESGWFNRVLIGGDVGGWLRGVLDDLGIDAVAPDKPTWRDLCAVVAPLYADALDESDPDAR